MLKEASWGPKYALRKARGDFFVGFHVFDRQRYLDRYFPREIAPDSVLYVFQGAGGNGGDDADDGRGDQGGETGLTAFDIRNPKLY
jgi:hypothetical protein